MDRDDLHKLFKSPGPVVMPVVHVLDRAQAMRNIAVAARAGAASGSRLICRSAADRLWRWKQ